IVITSAFSFSSARAEVSQSYIDELKETMPPEENPIEGSYIDHLKTKIPHQEESETSYIEELRSTDPEAGRASEGSFIEAEKAKLEPKPPGVAIAALHEGRSELGPKREGEIKGASGFRVGAAMDREILVGGTRDVEDIYGNEFAP